jgi:hypothetical protein
MEKLNLEAPINSGSQCLRKWDASAISPGVGPYVSSVKRPNEHSAKELAAFGKYLCDLLFETAFGSSGDHPTRGPAQSDQ